MRRRQATTLIALLLAGVGAGLGCEAEPATNSRPGTSSAASASSRSDSLPTHSGSTLSASASAPRAAAPVPTHQYSWLQLEPESQISESLKSRFPEPPGARRVEVGAGSFGDYLRLLPMAPRGTPVRSNAGKVILEPGDPRYAGVIALDVGEADLQQCADAVIRLHAEWSWARGRRDMSYRSASGIDLDYARYARGQRIVAQGPSIHWAPGASPATDYHGFRNYLNTVFAWANTVSLQRQARAISPDELRPGDFFVDPGNPGHTVLVLDLATQRSKRFALLGQSFMPAQNFQVLRPAPGLVWFELDQARPVKTPFWRAFSWQTLRRLD